MKTQAIVVLAALLGIIAMVRGAAAQDMSEIALMANPVSASSVQSAERMLGLDADQKTLVRDLHKGYRASWKQILAEARESQQRAQQAAREADDFKAMRNSMRTLVLKAVDDALKLNTTFEQDVKSLLSPEQAERFASFERARRREAGRYLQLLAGEGVDLIDALDATVPAWRDSAELRVAIDAYEVDLDRHVLDRQRLLRAIFDKMLADADEEETIRVEGAQLMQAARAGRDVMRVAARKIGERLDPDRKEAFEKLVRERSYPRIYRASPIDAKFKAVGEMADLTDSQRGELADLRAAFTREADAIRLAACAAMDAAQDAAGTNPNAYREARQRGQDLEAPLDELAEKLAMLEKQHTDRLKNLLSSEQRERLKPTSGNPRTIRFRAEPDFDHEALKEFSEDPDQDRE